MSSKKLFSEEWGPLIYGAVMPRERFHFLVRNISFDDEETRAQRWKKDRFAALREIFEKFNDQCSSVLCPDDYISLHETLYPMRTQIQYNPNKPAKYGLLFKSINAARYPFTFVSAPYAGKPEEDDGEFYVQGTEPIVKQLINRLGAKCLQGRNISMDRL